MTLLTTVFAAVFCTVIWYKSAPKGELQLGMLCWMYGGASLMWLADAIVTYAEEGAACFTPSSAQMLNDLFLGLSVVALGLVIWLVRLLLTDPRGVVREALQKRK